MMSKNEEDLEAVELSIEQAKSSIDTMGALLRLTNNKDFIKIMTEGYFEEEACRLVLLKADPSMQGPVDQQSVIKSIDAIGSLRQYFIKIMHFGRMAERALEDDENTREEILAEVI